MANATTSATVTIRADEAAHFGKLAAEWWDPAGSSAMLHKLNPLRLGFLRQQVDSHWHCEPAGRRPLAGRRALDVGCGAGLLAEPLARLGASVTAIDAAPENIAAARMHAEGQGLAIDYRHGELAALTSAEAPYDLVTCMEVIEHVADPSAFVAELAAVLSPTGLLVLSTPNRTALSRLAMITIGEGVGGIPRGTHDWQRFLTPDEMETLLSQAGLRIIGRSGVKWSMTRGLVQTEDEGINFMLAISHI